MTTPLCRVCKKPEPVICYPIEQPDLAICPDCCDKADHADGEHGHQFEHDRWEGWICKHCGINRNCTTYNDSYID